jgi:3-hydroxyisobutyrate dehydrogenase-like beta-hydroxyacid dehydrogenase
VDAPVLGSRIPAEQGKLIVMAGGDEADVQRVRPILEPMARSIHHLGPVGAGQQMKLATNLMLAHMLTGLTGAISLARAVHLKASDLIDILEAGLGSPYFRVKGGQMASGNFHPQFTIDLVRKDLGLIQDALDQAGVPLPTVAPIRELFEEAGRRGWGGEDGAAVVKLFGGAPGTTAGPSPSSTLR